MSIARVGVVFLLAVVLSIGAQERGSICGFVKNERGEPASLIHVVAMYLGPHSGPYDSAITDVNGRYCIEGMRAGEYAMSADDPAKGYPALNAMFYAEHAPEPRITISPQSWFQLANWSIPYKAGFLRVHATDHVTGNAISSVSLYLAVGGSEELRYMRGSSGTDMPILLPPNEEVYVTVSADGYQPWPAGEGKGQLVEIQPGGILDFPVALDTK